MEKVGDAFVWPFRDPKWVEKIAVTGLIGLIPIVGAMNNLGWMLAALHRLRAGEEELPPANFDHLGKGLELFLVFLAYGIVVVAAATVFWLPALIVLTNQNNALVGLLGVLLLLLAFAVAVAAILLSFALRAAIVLAFDQRGFAGAFDVGGIVRRAAATPSDTLIAGLMLLAAGFIGGLGGAVLCVVGSIFTVPYSLAMEAWILRSYEIGSHKEEGLDVGHTTAAG